MPPVRSRRGSIPSSAPTTAHAGSAPALLLCCFAAGDIPPYLFALPALRFLRLDKNQLSGPIEEFDAESSCFIEVVLSGNVFTGQFPKSFFQLASLTSLEIDQNNFEGSVDLSSFWRLRKLAGLDLSHNKLSVIIEEGDNSVSTSLFGLVALGLACCNITKFPSFLTHLESMSYLDLSCNRITGDMPKLIWERWNNGLFQLNLSHNMFTGELSSLYVLVLRSNRFYGSIDDINGEHRHRGYFSSLQIVDLSFNKFSGNFHSEWFGQLKSMMAKFNSTGDIVRATNLSGMAEFYQDSTEITYKGSSMTFERILTTLTAIDFSNNRLEGTIPASLGRLVSLRVLNMSHNAFTGKIPAQLGGMTDLESLDLSCNELSGHIPQELTDLTFLGTLNLSQNQLLGKIPQSRQFSTFESSSFKGNLGLCGPPLSNHCGISPAPPSPVHVDDSSQVDVMLFLFVGLGFGIGFSAAILVRWGRIGVWFVKSARSLLA